jgi:hypothetical protein
MGGQAVWMSYEKALFCSKDGELQVVYVHLLLRRVYCLSAGHRT